MSKTLNINNSNSTIVKYSGKVTIDIIRDGKTIKQFSNHNDGFKPLFNFIINCLAGNYIEADRPQKIYTFYIDENVGKEKFVSGIPLSISEASASNIDSILSYKILIPSTVFSTNKKLAGLLFYSKENMPQNIIANDLVPDTSSNENTPSMKMYIKKDDINKK